jgi:hypothetical protein
VAKRFDEIRQILGDALPQFVHSVFDELLPSKDGLWRRFVSLPNALALRAQWSGVRNMKNSLNPCSASCSDSTAGLWEAVALSKSAKCRIFSVAELKSCGAYGID